MKSDIQKDLLGLMRAPSYTPLTLPQIAAALGLPRKSAPKLRKAMDSLLADGRAARSRATATGFRTTSIWSRASWRSGRGEGRFSTYPIPKAP